MNPSLVAPKRKLVQWLTTLLVILLPFLRVGGESLLRIDAASRSILFFGATLRIEEFYLFLIAVLILVFAFLFVTMVFGRVWCGWLCPQTTLTDLAELLDRLVGRVAGKGFPSLVLRHLVYLAIASTVAANLVWYFISPYDFFPRLARGEMGLVAGITLVSVAAIVYLDLSLVRRMFCTTVCPYGRIQLMTMDRNTLTLEFDQAVADRCRRCGACVRACPVGIDIREGLQVECINCGRCLDACRQVMAPDRQPGLIHYTFGREQEGGGRPVNVKSVLLAGMVLLLTVMLAYAAATRKEATIKIMRAGSGEVRRLPDGTLINAYSAYLENRSRQRGEYTISVSGPAGSRTELFGQVRDLWLDPNANRRVDFFVKLVPAPTDQSQLIVSLSSEGKVLATARASFPVR